MRDERTTRVQPAPAHPAELGLRLIDWTRQVDELAAALAADLLAECDPDQEFGQLVEGEAA
jgi:hypothetical protein